MFTLVLLRHGQSQWNLENRFTGWTDVPLTERGIQEAHTAGKKLAEKGLLFDEVHCNLLKRCIKSTWIALEEMDLMWIPIYKTWRLNERHYGALQGLNKADTAKKFGEDQVRLWRRSYDVRPPALTPDDKRFPAMQPRYHLIEKSELPLAESLKDTLNRTLPYYIDEIAPKVLEGKKILISASGNSLRAIVKHIEDIPDDNQQIIKINIPTGIPLVYELDKDLNMITKQFLASDKELDKAVNEVKNQAKARWHDEHSG